MECTHLVVPGMVIEKIQGRPLSSISFDMQAVAKYMNEYQFKNDGPLHLLFREEVIDGQGKGFPYVIEIADYNTKLYQAQAGRGRRGSILGKQKGAEVDHEVVMAQRHARRMSIDARKMSTSGSNALDDAAAATAAHAKSLRMSKVDEGPTSTVSTSRGGRRGSIASVDSTHDTEQSRSSVGGRRGPSPSCLWRRLLGLLQQRRPAAAMASALREPVGGVRPFHLPLRTEAGVAVCTARGLKSRQQSSKLVGCSLGRRTP